MSRFVDSGAYMFHRNLFKLADAPEPDPRHARAPAAWRSATVSNWLEDVDAADDDARLQVATSSTTTRRRSRSTRASRRSPQQYPDIAEIVTLPNKTNGYQRKAQATIGGTGQSAVVVSSARVGP